VLKVVYKEPKGLKVLKEQQALKEHKVPLKGLKDLKEHKVL
jgi:hypothetical protein